VASRWAGEQCLELAKHVSLGILDLVFFVNKGRVIVVIIVIIVINVITVIILFVLFLVTAIILFVLFLVVEGEFLYRKTGEDVCSHSSLPITPENMTLCNAVLSIRIARACVEVEGTGQEP
jgi:hypothetical protein